MTTTAANPTLADTGANACPVDPVGPEMVPHCIGLVASALQRLNEWSTTVSVLEADTLRENCDAAWTKTTSALMDLASLVGILTGPNECPSDEVLKQANTMTRNCLSAVFENMCGHNLLGRHTRCP